jgi:glycine/D-amino acid oxidase-like deaminating enzyme
MDTLPPGISRSLYRAVTPDTLDFTPLKGEITTDVAIVGAGYTGLSTALHLRDAGIDTAIVEAHDVGWGASGRNGGQVNPGLKSEPLDILRDFGEERGTRLLELAGNAPAYVFDVVKRHRIDCAAINSGTIRLVRHDRDRSVIERSVREWRDRGVGLELLDRRKLAALTGTAAYPAGLFDPRGGQLNPLAYARGLAGAVNRLGGKIFIGSPATAIDKENDGWRLTTAQGSARARSLVLATNGYTDGLWPQLKQTVVPVYSAITATDPLPKEVLAKILPGRQVVYESSWRILYFRIDDAGRFLMGGPSVLRDTGDERDYAHLIAHAKELYPELSRFPWRYFWNGQVAVTKDHYPHLHEPAPGIIAGLGYNGRGVAMATTMGRLIARRILGCTTDELELPVTHIKPFAFHPLWKLAVTGRRLLGATSDRLRARNA